MTATRSGLDLVIRVDESEGAVGTNFQDTAIASKHQQQRRSPVGTASSPTVTGGWPTYRQFPGGGLITGYLGNSGAGSAVDEMIGPGQLGSRTSLNSGVRSSSASLDVHVPSLPTLDSFRGRQDSVLNPYGFLGDSGLATSFSCPCLFTAITPSNTVTGGADIAANAAGETSINTLIGKPPPLGSAVLFPRASSIFDMQHTPHPAAASIGLAAVKGNLLSLPAAISPFTLRRRANYRRKCEDWLDHMAPAPST